MLEIGFVVGCCVGANVINSISDPVSVYLVEWNILVPAYFGIPFQGVSGFLKYIYIYIYICICMYMNTHVYNLLSTIYCVSIVKILSI